MTAACRGQVVHGGGCGCRNSDDIDFTLVPLCKYGHVEGKQPFIPIASKGLEGQANTIGPGAKEFEFEFEGIRTGLVAFSLLFSPTSLYPSLD